MTCTLGYTESGKDEVFEFRWFLFVCCFFTISLLTQTATCAKRTSNCKVEWEPVMGGLCVMKRGKG